MSPHEHAPDPHPETVELSALSEHREAAHMAETGRRLKKAAVIVVVVLIAAFAIVRILNWVDAWQLSRATAKEAAQPPIVDVITAQKAPDSSSLTLPGATAAWYESTIYARIDGYVGNWTGDIGDHVRKGQVLATIETPDLDAQLVAARAKLKAGQAVVAARRADAYLAKLTYDRWRDSPKGVVSDQERDAKKAGYDSAVAQLNEAQAQVGLDNADVDRYMALSQFKKVTAPFDGTISERHIDIGNLITAGSTAATTPLYRVTEDDPLRVFIDVPQNAADEIKVGAAVKVSADNSSARIFEGKVARTADSISPQTRTLRVEVDIPNQDHALVPGMYVNVDFQVASTGLVEIPAAALAFRSNGPEVAVIDKDNHLVAHKVTIARDNGNLVELGSGIAPGDRVALNASSQIADGTVVEAHGLNDGSPSVSAKK